MSEKANGKNRSKSATNNQTKETKMSKKNGKAKSDLHKLALDLAKKVKGEVEYKNDYRIRIDVEGLGRVLGIGKWGFSVPKKLGMKSTLGAWPRTGGTRFAHEGKGAFPAQKWAVRVSRAASHA